MFSLGIRKVLIILIVAGVFLAANILIVASWLQDHGVIEAAGWIRREFLTGTAITILIALLILLVSPRSGIVGHFGHRCDVCGAKNSGRANYCSTCGSRG